MARICLITPGQPSTNPRLVKEADALVEAGHEVVVICAHWARWADETDKAMLSSRRFACTYVGGHPARKPLLYWWTRLRHKAGRSIAIHYSSDALNRWALCRVTPELAKAAQKIKAHLYIAHNLGALPAAVYAARMNHAKVGFDAEDYHSGMQSAEASLSNRNGLAEHFEREGLSACNYVTAATPLVAEAYSVKYSIPKPTTILNVFPLMSRQRELPLSDASKPLTLYWFSQTIGSDRGLEDVIAAMGILRGCKIELHLRGTWSAGYQRLLFQQAETVGLAAGQIIHHKPAPPDEMVRLSSEFDIGLSIEPGRSENNSMIVSNKLFTYLLAGNAVIATGTRGQRPFIEEVGSAGRCYEPGDAEALARILKRCYEDRVSLNYARRCAWLLGTTRYNWDVEKLKFLDLIEHVLDSSSRFA